ncbi:thioredoxin family protein [Pedobacter sp. ASV12]|uniref:thioredoxin family protein n=1 Tax=Pedobacter sp. ASV12 TaxID=2795120 RepID=UPI0018EDA5A0|nr:thioredoxin family protein [Pedobacter sp. ASV12]
MKRLVVTWIMLLVIGSAKTQLRAFSFAQLDSLQKIAQRKVLVFVYTDWCNYCQAMERQVFGEASIQQQLKQNYYWIALNAEEQSPISYGGHTFVFKASKGVHELAIALMPNQKKLAFPFLAILDQQNQISFQREGFMGVAELKKVLAYFRR